MPPPRLPTREGLPTAEQFDVSLPDVRETDTFRQVVKKLSLYFKEVIELPSTFEQLRTTAAGNCLRVLVDHLVHTCDKNEAIVNALLALKWHYASDDEQQGLGPTRSMACEIVAWRFLARFPERTALDFCLYEIPEVRDVSVATTPALHPPGGHDDDGELAPLLARFTSNGNDARRSSSLPTGSNDRRTELLASLSRLTKGSDEGATLPADDPSAAFEGLNALEIAAVADAKRFLSQYVVQKIITGIWNGNIVYWDALSINANKQPRFYNPSAADPFSRLRVPKYMKCWEVVFFCIFLCFYYTVLIKARRDYLTGVEAVLWFWFAAFLYDELSEWADAGPTIYTADIWNFFDIAVIVIGFVFIIMRVVGITTHDHELNSLAFDILALEALFLIPRVFSILSLSPYWGTLIPCLKEMGRDFCKFMVLLSVFFLGFLTTFSLIGRDNFKLSTMSIMLTRIFFGSSYIGFDYMDQIDPVLGPPLMIILVIFSNILLLSSLTSILANSFSRVTLHAKEEYLYVYAVYVLESCTSNSLVEFYPPFNFIAFLIFGPWSAIFPKSPTIRKARIATLRLTHLPIVGCIKIYETFRHRLFEDEFSGFKGPDEPQGRNGRPSMPQMRPSSAQHTPTMPLPGQSKKSLERDQAGVGANGDASLASQVSELNKKIDNITTALLAMQENQSAVSKAAAAADAEAAEEQGVE